MSHRTIKWLVATMIFVAVTIGMVGVALAQSPDAANTPSETKIEAALATKLAGGSADYIVRFKEQADLSAAIQMGWTERGQYVYDTLRQTAEASQKDAKAVLDRSQVRYETFIAGNELYVWGGNLESVQALAALPEVDFIRATKVYYIDPVKTSQEITWIGDLLNTPYGPSLAATAPLAPQATIDWGITDTKADQFWSTFGVQGSGIVVANIDSGVQWNHPALVNQFKCLGDPTNPACWYDPSNVCGGSACDNNGHGTHTMGTMVASDDPALLYTAGMAPDAQWIACKGCESNSCSDLALNACADWVLAPGGDPANRPHIVNNSWGGSGGEDWYLAKVNAWRAAGIFPAFSAGNAGPTCGSHGSPGDYQESFSSANHMSSRVINSQSSRGPSSFGHDPYTKPNISAPGTNICSSVPGNGWDCTYSGTSMASPHTAGAVGLLWSCNPSLVGQIDQTFQILQDTVDPPTDGGNCGAPPDGEGNYTYGYGYLNVLNAGLQWCGESGTLEGTVTDGATGDPINLAEIYTDPGPYATTTDAAGFYQVSSVMAGTFTVYAEAFGYYPENATVVIVADQTTIQDFALEAAPAAVVSGYVTDSETGWPLYAWIAIDSYPGGGLWSDPVTGYYEVSLPSGTTYDFTVNAWSAGYTPASRSVNLISNTTENFALNADLVACTAPGYQRLGGFIESFDNTSIPAGWTVVNNGGACEWQFNDPGTRGNLTGGSGNFAVADSDACGSGTTMNTTLYSPIVDLSGLPTVQFNFKYDYNNYSASEVAVVDVSSNGGTTWTNLFSWNSDHRGPGTYSQDLTPLLGGSNQAQVRWRYVAPGWDWWWEIDDVQLDSCVPPTNGGLTVGNIYDANTDLGLNGATVTNPVGSVSTVGTPDDPAVADGFYTLFTPAGTHPYTATIGGGYLPETTNVTALANDTVQQDFHLDAGWLSSAAPTGFDVDVTQGFTLQDTLTLYNTGTAVTNFMIHELPRTLQVRTNTALPGNKPETFRRIPIDKLSDSTQANIPLADIIQDGSFEAGTPNSYWEEYSTNYGTPICDTGSCGTGGGTAGPRTGAFWAWFGGIPAYEEGSLSQDLIIPVGTASLNFWFWIGTTGGPVNNYFQVLIDGNEVFRATADQQPEYSSYIEVVVDISEYADGEGHTVEFHSEIFGVNTNFSLDDVALDSQEFVDVPWLTEEPVNGTIDADSTAEIDVTFASMNYTVGTQLMALLRVKSDDPYNDTIQIPVTMTIVAPAFGVSLASDQELSGLIGETVTYQVTVTNLSNGPEDTFDITVSGNGWTTTAPAVVGPLDPGQSDTFDVSVEIPINAAPGTSDEAVVTATSQGDDANSASVTLTTLAEARMIYLPLVMNLYNAP